MNLTTEIKYNQTVPNKWYFCTKIKKRIVDNNENNLRIKKGKNKNNISSKISPKKELIKKKKSNIGMNNSKKMNFSNYNFNKKNITKNQENEKISQNKSNAIKFSKSFQTFYKNNQTNKSKSKHKKNMYNNILNPTKIFQNKNRAKNNTANPKYNIKLYPKLPYTYHPKKLKYKKNNNDINKDNNNTNSSSSSSSFDRDKNHNSLFYQLLYNKDNNNNNNKKNKNYKDIFSFKRSISKLNEKNSEEKEPNGQSSNGIEKKIIMPKIYDNNSFKTPKYKNYSTIFNSKDLIRKINSTNTNKNKIKNIFFEMNRNNKNDIPSTYNIN